MSAPRGMAARVAPALSALVLLAAWEALVRIAEIPHYTLPAPSLVAQTLWENLGSLLASWWYTMRITFGGLALAVLGVESTTAALLLCTWVVAFFPILSNTVIGLRAADPHLRDLFRLYRATPWQRLRLLLVPSALPYFVGGLKIAGGLALIGSVTAEMVAGVAGRETGLASRILEASFRTETPKMFAALVLLMVTGVLIFWFFAAISRRLLGRWHASERP